MKDRGRGEAHLSTIRPGARLGQAESHEADRGKG
jgi:hypothetical protein